MDDGADVVGLLHTERTDAAAGVIGGTEETTTGVIRLKSMEQEGVLRYPIVAVNEAMTKHMFDNRYGTGQSHPRRHHPGYQSADRLPRRSSWWATAGAGGAWPCGPGAWGRMSSSPRSIRSGRSKR